MAVNYVPSTFKKISEFPGIAATANPDQADPELKSSDPSSPLFEFSTVFPLSSSLAVIQISTLNSLSVCTRLD